MIEFIAKRDRSKLYLNSNCIMDVSKWNLSPYTVAGIVSSGATAKPPETGVKLIAMDRIIIYRMQKPPKEE